jgi:hypothetical protein
MRYLQAKSEPTVGAPGDRYEREADAVADRVMAMPEPTLQRQKLEEEEPPEVQTQVEEEEELVQTEPSIGDSTQRGVFTRAKLHAAECPGQPLAPATRDFYEPRLGRDFGGVRVHTCDVAAGMCRGLNAQAFTYGNNIFFNKGKYEPGTSSGKRLLAHELAHTVQQGSSTPSIQRNPLTIEERQENLSSEKYAWNLRLQRAYDNSPPMKIGETGEAVRLVQEGLAADGIPLPISTNEETGELDGIFGPETRGGVREFQYKYAGDGLLEPYGQADGIVGRNTMGKLDELAQRGKTTEAGCETEIKAYMLESKGIGCDTKAKIHVNARRCTKTCDKESLRSEAYSEGRQKCTEFCKEQGCRSGGALLPASKEDEEWSYDCYKREECPAYCPREEYQILERTDRYNCVCGFGSV